MSAVPRSSSAAGPRFTIGSTDFRLDDAPFQVISGALHYFRVHPDQWADRIDAARRMGLNTIETYVPWNEHQPSADVADFTGRLDLGRFLDLVHDAGLYAIVRPGPYICAEWDNGGLPAWLFRTDGIGIRRAEPRYLAAVEAYLSRVLEVVAPRQVSRGGPVVLLQVENEYGAYGDDADYLRELVALVKAGDIDVPLVTCDQADATMLSRGGLPDLLKTATFGSRAAERLAVLRSAQLSGPLMCMEFWNGWFDHWGTHHHTTDADAAAAELEVLLAAGASVNIYMFHGGTNFGFTSGANDKGIYEPTTTSYDYDAPLAEDGHPSAKYHAYREVIARYAPVPAEPPPARAAAPQVRVRLDRMMPLLDLAGPHLASALADAPPSMDALGHYRGFVLYSASLPGGRDGTLVLGEVRDRAQIFVDDRPVATVSRDHGESVVLVPPGERLQILVEDQGRVNYGPRIGEPKGLLGVVTLDGVPLTGWHGRPLPLDPTAIRASAVSWSGGPRGGAFAALGTFELAEPADLYLDTTGWTKGVAFVNGENLGRYWSRGPQRTLYVPGPVTRPGPNELVLVEQHGTRHPYASFVAHPDLGPHEP